MVIDNILVTKLGLREAARGYLINLKASNLSPRYFEGMEMVLRQFADYAEIQGGAEVSQVTASHIEKCLVYLPAATSLVRVSRLTEGSRVCQFHLNLG